MCTSMKIMRYWNNLPLPVWAACHCGSVSFSLSKLLSPMLLFCFNLHKLFQVNSAVSRLAGGRSFESENTPTTWCRSTCVFCWALDCTGLFKEGSGCEWLPPATLVFLEGSSWALWWDVVTCTSTTTRSNILGVRGLCGKVIVRSLSSKNQLRMKAKHRTLLTYWSLNTFLHV